MNSTDLSCREFIALLASAAPAPGGGGAAALVGAIGTALGNMVASLTIGKPKYADAQDELLELQARADALQERLLDLVAKDAKVFLPLSQAYGLPKDTEEEAAHKAQVMEKCLAECAQVPLDIMDVCGRGLIMVERIEQIGTAIAISDAGCAALTLKAALQSAYLNVRVNTKLMKDRETADSVNRSAVAVLRDCLPLADEIYEAVMERCE